MYLDLRYPAHLALLCSSVERKKIVFTFGKFHHSAIFSLRNCRISCHVWCIVCLKENHWRKKKNIPIALILSLCFWDRMGGKSALSSLTRHSLCFCTQKKEKCYCKKFYFQTARENPTACTCLSEHGKLSLLSRGALHGVLGQTSGRNLSSVSAFSIQ